MVARTCTPEARPDRTAPSGLGAPLVIKPVLSMVFNRVLLVALLVLAAAVPAASESIAAAGIDRVPGDLPACPGQPSSVLYVSPFYGEDGLLFATTGTIWRSNDGGRHWEAVLRISDWYPNAATSKTVIAPFRSSGALNLFTRAYWWYPMGLVHPMMHSDDNGDTWQIYQICDELHAYCRNWEMRYYFTNEPDTWFVARHEGFIDLEADILRWSGGQSFSTVWQETGATGLSISPDYANDHLLYAGLYPPSPTLNTSFIRSYDGGETWADASGGGLCPGVGADMRFSPDFATDRTVFALQYGSIFKSLDGGNTWRYLYPPGGSACLTPDREDAVWDLQLSPHYAADHTLYATVLDNDPREARLLVSADGGASWQLVLQIPGAITDLVVAANPPVLEPSPESSAAASPGRGTARNSLWPTSQTRLFLPLALARGPKPRPLTLFINAGVPVPGSYRYTSDDGGLTWRCLNLPPDHQDIRR